jgi:hypothetical protein
MEQQLLVGQGLHIIEASRSYSNVQAAKEFQGVVESTEISWNVTLRITKWKVEKDKMKTGN